MGEAVTDTEGKSRKHAVLARLPRFRSAEQEMSFLKYFLLLTFKGDMTESKVFGPK